MKTKFLALRSLLLAAGLFLAACGVGGRPMNIPVGEATTISGGFFHTVGIRNDGTVVATAITTEGSGSGQSDVSGWRGIVAVSAGGYHTVGLRSNGRVVVAVGEYYTIDLWSSGRLWTVVTVVTNVGQSDVSGRAWRDIKVP